MREGEVTVITNDETAGLGVDPVDTNLNILALGVTPYGPTKLARVSGPSDFKRTYNGGQGITPNDSYDMQYVRALLNSAPIYFKRITRQNDLLGGVSSYGNSEIYVDKNLNPIKGHKVQIDASIPDYATTLNNYFLAENYSAVVVNDKVYSQPEIPSITGTLFKDYANSNHLTAVENKERIPDNYLYYDFNVKATCPDSGDITFTVGSFAKSFPYSSYKLKDNFRYEILHDFYQSLVQNSGLNADFFFGNKLRVSYSDLNDFPVGGTGFGFLATTEIQITDSESTGYFLKKSDNTSYCPRIWYSRIKSPSEYEDGYELDDYGISLTSSGVTYAFYKENGSVTPSPDAISIVCNKSKVEDILTEFTSSLNGYIGLSTNGANKYIVPDFEDIQSLAGFTIQDLGEINSSAEFDKFAIISKFPNSTPIMDITVSKVDSDTNHIVITYGDEIEDFDFSFTPGKTDGYGVDISYSVVNDKSNLVYIVPLDGSQFNEFSTSMGNEITNDHIDANSLADTLEYIMEVNESPVMFDYIVDSGISSKTNVDMIKRACDKYFAFYPMSCSLNTDRQGNRDKALRGDLDWSLGNANFISAVQRDRLLDSGISKFPGSLYYLRTRIGLAKTVFEFQPIFAETNGDVGISNPVVVYTQTIRESLLDNQIVSLDRNISTGAYFLNSNQTLRKGDSYLQEDGIALMNLKISQITYAYGKTLRGLYNTPELRSSINGTDSQLGMAISNRLRVGTQNGPDSIKIVCDSTNNPLSLQQKQKIRIDIYARYNRSIKDVLVYSHVQSLEP